MCPLTSRRHQNITFLPGAVRTHRVLHRVIAFELCDLWRYSLTKFMQNMMRAHSAGQISIEGGVDVNKGHMVYTILRQWDHNLGLSQIVAPRNRGMSVGATTWTTWTNKILLMSHKPCPTDAPSCNLNLSMLCGSVSQRGVWLSR